MQQTIRKGTENEDQYSQTDEVKRQTLAVFCILRVKKTVIDWTRNLEMKTE